MTTATTRARSKKMPSRVSSVFFIMSLLSLEFEIGVEEFLDQWVRRFANLLGRANRPQFAVDHHAHAISNRESKVAIVAHHNRGYMNARFKIKNFFADGDGHQRVEFAGRFVVKDQLRIDDERAGNGDALFHAAGKFAWIAVLDVLEAEKIELLDDDALDFCGLFQLMFRQIKADILADGKRTEQSAGLKDHR